MLKPGSLIPPVYLRRSHQTACDTGQTYKNIAGLCWCACEAELEYTSQANGLTSVVGTFFCSHTGTVFQAVPAAMSWVACAASENQA